MNIRIVPAAAVIVAGAVLAPAVGIAAASEAANRLSSRAVVSDVSASTRPAVPGLMPLAPESGRAAPRTAASTGAAVPASVAVPRVGFREALRALVVGEQAGDDGSFGIPGEPKLFVTEQFFLGRTGKLLTAGLNVIGLPVQVTYAALVAAADIVASLPQNLTAGGSAAEKWEAFTFQVRKADAELKDDVARGSQPSAPAEDAAPTESPKTETPAVESISNENAESAPDSAAGEWHP